MHIGPRNITNGLVFGYDVGSDFSYYGEPTTNILPSPEYNGRFTTANSWGTYNTNQYCGNNGCGTYWTIPSISSVSSNIITTSSAHQIRSFDVIQPNATGGGVNSGQNYVAKKISDTQFSLHEYNASQDGSQGYINPTTGFFKVHDAYANDTRVSVSASGFPTGWWGYPHLPNSGLIKEVVTNGGRIPGTNCMRLHAYRPDGVADGMAYGVYTPVTQGQVVTLSFWHKAASPTSVGQSHSWSTYFYGYSAPSAGFTTQEYWQKHQTTWTASYTCSFYFYMWPSGLSTFDIADLQVEVKDHATKFTLGTRSATASIKDMIGVSTLDVSAASFNSDNNPTFDGTNDTISIANNSSINIAGDITLELVLKRISGQTGVPIHKETQYTIRIYDDNSITYADSTLWSYASFGAHGSAITPGNYHHVVVTKTGSTVTIYVNNNVIVTKSFGGAITQTSNSLYIGSYNGSSNYFKGEIPVSKIYNRALSASEISQHYYSYKTRFGLS
jgi:hypothetical protein